MLRARVPHDLPSRRGNPLCRTPPQGRPCTREPRLLHQRTPNLPHRSTPPRPGLRRLQARTIHGRRPPSTLTQGTHRTRHEPERPEARARTLQIVSRQPHRHSTTRRMERPMTLPGTPSSPSGTPGGGPTRPSREKAAGEGAVRSARFKTFSLAPFSGSLDGCGMRPEVMAHGFWGLA